MENWEIGFLWKLDAEQKNGIRSYKPTAFTTVMSKWCASCVMMLVEKEKEPESWRVTNTACACTQVMSPSSTSKLHSEYTPIIFPNETEFFQPEHDFSTDAASDGSNLEVQRLAVSSRHAVASTERKISTNSWKGKLNWPLEEKMQLRKD